MYRPIVYSLARTAIRRPVLQPVRNQSELMEKFSNYVRRLLPNRTDLGSARSLLYNCKYQADNALWHTRGLIGTDFRSKQVLLMVHIWMIHKRLITEGKEGRRLQEALFDQLWEDTGNRIRGQGVNELSVNKYLKDVQGYSFRICVELDHVLSLLKQPVLDTNTVKKLLGENTILTPGTRAKPNSTEITPSIVNNATNISMKDAEHTGDTVTTTGSGSSNITDQNVVLTSEQAEALVLDEISGVLWRMIYLQKEDLNEEHVMEFARYVRSEQLSLMELSRDAVFEARVQWGPLPSWGRAEERSRRSSSSKHQSDRSSSAARSTTPTSEFKGEWKEATAPDGKPYYWNTLTRESKWDKPKDFDAQRAAAAEAQETELGAK